MGTNWANADVIKDIEKGNVHISEFMPEVVGKAKGMIPEKAEEVINHIAGTVRGLRDEFANILGKGVTGFEKLLKGGDHPIINTLRNAFKKDDTPPVAVHEGHEHATPPSKTTNIR